MNHDSEGGCQRTVELTLNVWSVSIPAVHKREIFLMIKADFSLHYFYLFILRSLASVETQLQEGGKT